MPSPRNQLDSLCFKPVAFYQSLRGLVESLLNKILHTDRSVLVMNQLVAPLRDPLIKVCCFVLFDMYIQNIPNDFSVFDSFFVVSFIHKFDFPFITNIGRLV
jgi:hypothetical protein